MKLSIATIALAYVVSVVTAATPLNAMGATMKSDMTTNLAMTSDEATTTDQGMTTTTPNMRGHSTPSLFVPVGVITNKIKASGNNILVKGSNILISKSDRVQLAKTIKEMVSNSPEAGAASTMTTQDISGLLSSISANPAALSNTAGIISAARSGKMSAVAGFVVGLLGTTAPTTTTPGTPVVASMVSPTAMSKSTPVALAAATTTST